MMFTQENLLLFWDGPLSQWFPDSFSDTAGNDYSSCEQYMMYQKALLFGDEDIAYRILHLLRTPKEQKQLGRRIKGFDEEQWDIHKIGVVWQGNYLRFSQNERAKRFLLSTMNKHIAEASPSDCVWGIGLSANNADVYDQKKWRGENLLGEVLMSVRKIIRL